MEDSNNVNKINDNNTRLMQYNKDDTRFLLINILSHDVIHDFFGNLGVKRWKGAESVIKQFSASYTLSGGMNNQLNTNSGSSTTTTTISPSESNISYLRLKRGREGESDKSAKRTKIEENIPDKDENLDLSEKMDLSDEIKSDTDKNLDLYKRRFLKAKRFPGTANPLGEKTKIITFITEDDYFSCFIDDIAMDILFSYFYIATMNYYNGIKNGINKGLTLENVYDFFVPNNQNYDDIQISILYKDLYVTLADRFIDFCVDIKSNVIINGNFVNVSSLKEIDINTFFNLLTDFFNEPLYFDYTIYDFILNPQNIDNTNVTNEAYEEIQKDKVNTPNLNSNVSSNGETSLVDKISNFFSGGAKQVPLTSEDLAELNNKYLILNDNQLKDINNIIEELNEIAQIKEKEKDSKINAREADLKGKYGRLKSDVIKEIRSVVPDRTFTELDQLLFRPKINQYKDFLNDFKYDYDTLFIKPYEKLQEKSEIKGSKKAKLGISPKNVKQGFANFIIKGGLYICDISSKDSLFNESLLTPDELNEYKELFNSLSETLNEFAETINIDDIRERKNKQSELNKKIEAFCQEDKLENGNFIKPYIKEYIILLCVSYISSLKDSTPDYDGFLINYINDYLEKYKYTDKSNLRYLCETDLDYVVNNAAQLTSNIKPKVFCPYSSIFDAMLQCSLSEASKYDLIEYGNMDFNISNDELTMGYHGKTTINKNDMDNEVTSDCKVLITLPKIIINSNIKLILGEKQLDAVTSLKRTLVFLVDFIKNQQDRRPVLDKIFLNGDIFENLYDMAFEEGQFQTGAESVDINFIFSDFVIDVNAKNKNIFSVVFNKILSKGVGDLFQEINSVCKFGGYNMNYYHDGKILSFDTDTGDQTRLFLANDRPSASRFMFMLCHGKDSQINQKAIGGYMSMSNDIIVSKYENPKNDKPNPCIVENVSVTEGGKNNKVIKKTRKNKNEKKSKNKKTNRKGKNKKINKSKKIIKNKKIHKYTKHRI